jgi:MFS transporter, DHA1 family, multidrug resistance protein
MNGQRAAPAGSTFTLLLLLLLGAQPIATDLYLPALPAISRELGSASTSLTLFILAFGFGQLVNGPLADRWGRRPVLLAGLMLYTLCSLGSALAPNITTLASCRAVQGFAMAAILVCVRAAVRDLHPAHEGPRIMARGLSGLGAVALLAPLLGALIVQTLSWRWALACMAAYAFAALAICWVYFSETRQPAHGDAQGGLREVLSSRSFWVWTCLAATTFGAQFCFLLLSPAIYVEYFGLTPMQYGWIPASGSLVYVIATTWCRHLLSRHGVVRVVKWGSLLSVSGALMQLGAALFTPHSMWLLLTGHWVYSTGHGIHQPCGQAGAVGDFPHLAGCAVAWSGFVMMAVAFAAGQTATQFMDSAHSNGAWPLVVPMMLAGCSLPLIAYVWLPKALSNPVRAI